MPHIILSTYNPGSLFATVSRLIGDAVVPAANVESHRVPLLARDDAGGGTRRHRQPSQGFCVIFFMRYDRYIRSIPPLRTALARSALLHMPTLNVLFRLTLLFVF